MRFAVVCVEEQSEVDYTMPFRVIGYDLDRYEQQLRIRRQEHRERKDLKAEEYLSGISRDDRFLPVVTLVLYFGKHWDGPQESERPAGSGRDAAGGTGTFGGLPGSRD